MSRLVSTMAASIWPVRVKLSPWIKQFLGLRPTIRVLRRSLVVSRKPQILPVLLPKVTAWMICLKRLQLVSMVAAAIAVILLSLFCELRRVLHRSTLRLTPPKLRALTFLEVVILLQAFPRRKKKQIPVQPPSSLVTPVASLKPRATSWSTTSASATRWPPTPPSP